MKLFLSFDISTEYCFSDQMFSCVSNFQDDMLSRTADGVVTEQLLNWVYISFSIRLSHFVFEDMLIISLDILTCVSTNELVVIHVYWHIQWAEDFQLN